MPLLLRALPALCQGQHPFRMCSGARGRMGQREKRSFDPKSGDGGEPQDRLVALSEGPRLPDIGQIARARLRLSLLRRTSGLAGGKFSGGHCSGAAIRMGHGKERTADPGAGISGDTPENMVAVQKRPQLAGICRFQNTEPDRMSCLRRKKCSPVKTILRRSFRS